MCRGLSSLQKQILFLNSITKEEEQKAWVPMFTELGFEKTVIPTDVYNMLLWEYEKEIPFMYHEPFARGGINAEQIVTNQKKAQSSIKNMQRAFLTNLRYHVQLNIHKAVTSAALMWVTSWWSSCTPLQRSFPRSK